MHSLDLWALTTFFLISVLFFLIGSRPIIFHLVCATLLAVFVSWTGKTLSSSFIGEWVVMTTGLILYWFGLVIVRIMLTRSVSLHLLADFAQGKHSATVSEGIAGRLKDAMHFGLVTADQDRYSLTLFGKLIGTIVAISYILLRIK